MQGHVIAACKHIEGAGLVRSAGEGIAVACAASSADPLAAWACRALIAHHVPAHPAVVPPPDKAESLPTHLESEEMCT